MLIVHRLLLAMSGLAVAAGVTAQTSDAHLETGFVATANGNGFLYTTDGHLLSTSIIQSQYPAARGALACCMRLYGSALDEPSASTEPVSDALLGRPLFRYRLRTLPAALKGDPFVGAVVIGTRSITADVTSAGSTMQLTGASAASALTVYVCLGSEGINLFLIADGKLTSQIYYSFGYDVTATCNPKLFELPAAP